MAENEQTQPDLDLAKVQEFIKGQVQAYAQEAFDQAAATRLPQQQHRLTAEEDARKRLNDALDPFIRPGLDTANLNAADAKDYVDFYLNEPTALADKERVETIFREQASKGRPLPRKDIYQYVVGKRALEDPEGFNKMISARQKKQVAHVEGAVDVGLSAIDRARSDPVWSRVREMSAEELRNHLDGITF